MLDQHLKTKSVNVSLLLGGRRIIKYIFGEQVKVEQVYPKKHDGVTLCCFNVGPVLHTVGKHIYQPL